MRVLETVTYLEMTARDQLHPSRPPPTPLSVVQVGPDASASYRSTYERIAAGLNWQSRRFPPWTAAQWTELLSDPRVHGFLAWVGNDLAGMVEFEAQPDGDLEIAVFGLVPECVGRGLGGWFLTRSITTAWGLEDADGLPVSRVWLHTSSRDHPHARQNYERRGFRVFRTSTREVEPAQATRMGARLRSLVHAARRPLSWESSMPLLAVLAGAGIVALVRFAYKKLATAGTDEALAQAYIRGNDFYNRMPPGGVGPF